MEPPGGAGLPACALRRSARHGERRRSASEWAGPGRAGAGPVRGGAGRGGTGGGAKRRSGSPRGHTHSHRIFCKDVFLFFVSVWGTFQKLLVAVTSLPRGGAATGAGSLPGGWSQAPLPAVMMSLPLPHRAAPGPAQPVVVARPAAACARARGAAHQRDQRGERRAGRGAGRQTRGLMVG